MTRASRRFVLLITPLAVQTLLAGCGTAAPGAASPSVVTSAPTVAPSAASTVEPATTTTTVYAPAAAQPSAESAASDLVQLWATGARTQAASVAAPAAVAALFAAPYPGSSLTIDRGCSSSVPVICTFGPPGGGNPNAAIYQITTGQTSKGGWYVTAVTVEG